MPLSATDIKRAFEVLADELAKDGQHADLIVVGGAALVLLFSARESTKDVDAYFVRPEGTVLRTAAERVAERLDLPSDWLNDGAKGYLTSVSLGATLYDSPSLNIRAASLPQLLAMKLAAWRDAIDRADARLLLTEITGSREEIWSKLQLFVPTHLRDKASYAFEDLWESMYERD